MLEATWAGVTAWCNSGRRDIDLFSSEGRLMTDQPNAEVLRQTARVVSAHLGHNQVATEALPALILSVYQTLASLGSEPEASVATPTPAVPVRKSVFPDYIVCLEDGAKMKMLKRYLQTRFGLTPAAYRERWGLPSDYPMVAPSYTSRRSALAHQFGLGRKPAAEQPVEQEQEQVAETTADQAGSAPPETKKRRKAPPAQVEE